MNTYQNTQPRTGERQISAFASIALCLALSLMPSLSVKAQVQCLAKCEKDLELCVRNSGTDLDSGFTSCQELFELCVTSCLSAVTVLS